MAVLIVGLTGSIGMGKTTTAALFRRQGVPVYDADVAVHELYSGPAVAAIGAVFPDAIVDGAVDRARLSEIVVGKPEALRRLEDIVHPMVAENRYGFLQWHRERHAGLVILDIPLLFETGGETTVDAVIVVTAPAAVQRQRVLGRPGMTGTRFEAILSRQVPDEEKRRRAHFIVETGAGMAQAGRQVGDIVRVTTYMR
jgi:dephospho-CoA kinase